MNQLPSLSQSNFLSRYNIQENLCIAQGKYILTKKFDFDVYLPTKQMNLQRDLVWTIDQKRALIESIIVKRSIPPVSVIFTVDDVYEVIDGKQRLSALISYLNNEFKYCGYYYDALPPDYKFQIERFWVTAYRLVENFNKPLTDAEKVEWFKWINFAGTPQDIEHIERLNKERA